MLKEKLKELQVAAGLSDYKFADKLGVSPQLWQMTRSGKRQVGLVILRAVTKAYPELSRDILIFLGADVSIISQLGGITTIPSQTAQGGRFSRFKTLWSGLVLRARKLLHNSREP